MTLPTGVVDDLPDVCPVCHTTVGALVYATRTRHRGSCELVWLYFSTVGASAYVARTRHRGSCGLALIDGCATDR